MRASIWIVGSRGFALLLCLPILALLLEASLSSMVLLAQVRSMLVDLMELCGEEYTDARDSVPDMD